MRTSWLTLKWCLMIHCFLSIIFNLQNQMESDTFLLGFWQILLKCKMLMSGLYKMYFVCRTNMEIPNFSCCHWRKLEATAHESIYSGLHKIYFLILNTGDVSNVQGVPFISVQITIPIITRWNGYQNVNIRKEARQRCN